MACRADHALALDLDPALQALHHPFMYVYPEPALAKHERLWTYIAGYILSAVREGREVEIPRDLQDALDLASMLVVPAFSDNGISAVVAVFRGSSSPPLDADAEQVLHMLGSQFPDVARRAGRDADLLARAPRLLKVLQARGTLRSAGRLCCVLDAVALLVERAGLADAVLFRVLNQETGELEVIASSGHAWSDRAQDPVPASRCRAIRSVRAGDIMGHAGGAVCPLLRGTKWIRGNEALCVPVQAGREVVAVLELWMPPGKTLDATGMRLVEAATEAAGEAFAEARLHSPGGEGDSGSALIDMFAVVSKTSSDPAHVAAALLEALHATTAFDVAVVADFHDGRENVMVLQSCLFPPTGPGEQPYQTAESGRLSAFKAPETGFGCVAGDPDAEAWARQMLERAKPFACGLGLERLYLPDARWQVGLVVPLAVAGSCVAVLVLGRAGSAGFSHGEIDFLEGVRDGLADLWDSLVRRTRPSWRAAEQAMAERIATLEQLAAGAAHEIRNPLSVIKGYLQVMQSDPGISDATKKRIGRVFHQLDQINDVLEDFSQLARPMTPEFTPLSLTGLLEEVLEIVEPQASNIGIKIVRSYAKDSPEVVADGGKMQQVFLNLCRNSLEAMAPEGGGELRVSTRTSPDGRTVEVEFRDTGPGMASEVMSRIFSPFYTTKKHGTGLGLTISLHIVKQHGGTIRVESAPGAGAAFTAVLPVAPK